MYSVSGYVWGASSRRFIREDDEFRKFSRHLFHFGIRTAKLLMLTSKTNRKSFPVVHESNHLFLLYFQPINDICIRMHERDVLPFVNFMMFQ